jgi:hypothetical protein
MIRQDTANFAGTNVNLAVKLDPVLAMVAFARNAGCAGCTVVEMYEEIVLQGSWVVCCP